MRLSSRLSLALVLGALSAQPALSQDGDARETVPDFQSMSREELLGALRSGGDRWLDEPCTFGEPLFEALKTEIPGNPVVGNNLALTYVLCADEKEEYTEAEGKLEALEAEMPGLDVLRLGLYMDFRTENADRAMSRLRALDYQGAEELDSDGFWRAARMISKAGKGDALDDLALQWSEDGIFGALEFDVQPGLAFRALRSAVRQGRIDSVDDLLSYITSPNTYVTLLTDRKYEAIWSRIEQRAGPNLSKVGEQDVAIKMARLENSESDRDRFSDAAHALHFNGQFEDAIKLADQWQRREERGAEIEEGDGWALNIQAYAYDSLGQPEKADEVFDKLAEIDGEENYWVVNFLINRASRLVGQGRWEEGLKATDLAKTVKGSTYAELLIARDRTCALLKLDRPEEAAVELAFMLENVEDGAKIVVQGLMCHGRDEEAVQILMDHFADPTKKDIAIDAFEAGPLDLFYTQSVLRNASDLLPDHPELSAELAKHVRPMPEEFIPVASLKRVTLNLPDWE